MTRMVKKKAARKIAPAKTPAKPAKRATPKAAAKPAKKAAGLDIGSRGPAFVLPATIIREASAAQLKGKPFVLYFYPKDDTSGCTAEACGFQSAMPAFGRLGLPVIGVS